jgi:transposase
MRSGWSSPAPGFDHSVLSEFRGQLADHDLSRLCFDRVLDRCRELGLVKAGGKQRTDSTHVIAAVRDLTHAELAGEAVRALAEALAAVAPDFLAETVDLDALGEAVRAAGVRLELAARESRA